MGNCFSDPSSKKGGQVLGSGPRPAAGHHPAAGVSASADRPAPAVGARKAPQALGGGSSEAGRERERALAAAEERAKAANRKGVNAANPNAGKLSSKLQEERRTPRSPSPKNDNRMMDKGAWN